MIHSMRKLTSSLNGTLEIESQAAASALAALGSGRRRSETSASAASAQRRQRWFEQMRSEKKRIPQEGPKPLAGGFQSWGAMGISG